MQCLYNVGLEQMQKPTLLGGDGSQATGQMTTF